MPETSLPKKLGIKEGHRVLILNAPDGYHATLGPLPETAEVTTLPEGEFDVVQVFVGSKADVDRLAPTALRVLRKGGGLWFAHPKKSSKVKTDISRDVGWDAVKSTGMEAIATISIDDMWSGIRFRPSGDVKRKSR